MTNVVNKHTTDSGEGRWTKKTCYWVDELACLQRLLRISCFFNLKNSFESSSSLVRSWFMILTWDSVAPLLAIILNDLASSSKMLLWQAVLLAKLWWATAIFSFQSLFLVLRDSIVLAFFLPIGRSRLLVDSLSETNSKAAVDERGTSLLGLQARFFLPTSWDFLLFLSP